MELLTQILALVVAVFAVAVVTAYLYFTRKFAHWRKKGVPYLKPTAFMGNLKESFLMRKHFGVLLSDFYRQHKSKPFLGIFAMDEPILLINDQELVKSVLIKDFQYFVDRNIEVNAKVDPLGARGLFALKGDPWKHSRNAITPSFTSGKMKKMFEIVANCGELLAESLETDASSGKPVQVYEVSARYTTDAIASCAFGVQGNTLKDPKAEFRTKLRLAFQFSTFETIVLYAAFLSPKLVDFLGIKVLKQEVDDFVRKMVSSASKYREENKIKRNDLLDCLLELKREGRIVDDSKPGSEPTKTRFRIEDEDIAAHSMGFLTAGFETSATTITHALYELALNRNAQKKLRDEIKSVLSENGKVSYETLHGMKYLDMVISETLRKYPPLPFLDRKSNKPYTIPGTDITLEAGSRVIIPAYAIHTDPDIFQDPMHFQPERFSEDRKPSNSAYMPFGVGPRNCVGMRFALMQTKNALVHILHKYSVEPADDTPKQLEFNPKTLLLQPKKPIHLIFKRI